VSAPTAGPWTVSPDYPGLAPRIVDACRYEIARCIEPAEQRDANARLIAAAPQMLEALTSLVAAYDEDEGYGDSFVARIDSARAAIDKAEGR
jgi:hypothetical protein